MTLSKRFVIYLAVWLAAAIAVQIFLEPDGLTETHLTEIEQRIRWLLYTPLFAVLGLGFAMGLPATPWSYMPVLAGLLFFAILVLSCSRRVSYFAFILIHAALLTIGVTYFVQFSRLPSGG